MDDNEKLISEVKSFVKDFRLGIDEDTGPVISLEDISQFQGGGLRGKTTEEIEDFIFSVHSFNTRLKNKRASLKAFSLGLESKIGKYVSKNIEIVDKYLPYSVKKDAIISMSPEMEGFNARLISARMRIERIGDTPESIDNTLRSLESYLRRRFSNG